MENLLLMFTILVSTAGTICLSASLFLLLRSEGSRSRRILGGMMLMWGIIYLILLFLLYKDNLPFGERGFLSPYPLANGNLYVIITMYYIIEVIRPGWLNWRRSLGLLLPLFSLLGIYLIGLFLCGESVLKLGGISDLVLNISQFNVWFRFAFLLSVVFTR